MQLFGIYIALARLYIYMKMLSKNLREEHVYVYIFVCVYICIYMYIYIYIIQRKLKVTLGKVIVREVNQNM